MAAKCTEENFSKNWENGFCMVHLYLLYSIFFCRTAESWRQPSLSLCGSLSANSVDGQYGWWMGWVNWGHEDNGLSGLGVQNKNAAGNPLRLTKSCLLALRGCGCRGSARGSAARWLWPFGGQNQPVTTTLTCYHIYLLTLKIPSIVSNYDDVTPLLAHKIMQYY